jgi:hypothetical protein
MSALKQDRCEKYPDLNRWECEHCQQRTMPKYTMLDRGSSIELLKDGGPIHEWDSNFVLNAQEARTVLLAEPMLRRYMTTRVGESLLCQVEGVPDCLVSALKCEEEIHGRLCSWFFVAAWPPFSGHDVRLGRAKCDAACALEAEIRVWVEKRFGACPRTRWFEAGAAGGF